MPDAQETLKLLLEDRTAEEVRAMCITGLRRWWRSGRHDGMHVTLHSDLGRELVVELAAANALAEAGAVATELLVTPEWHHLSWKRKRPIDLVVMPTGVVKRRGSPLLRRLGG